MSAGKSNMAAGKATKPVVSFVVPVFNSEQYIACCLQSIKSLDFDGFAYEVVIMDNGSTDRTHQIMRDMGFEFHIVPKVNVSALRNRGAKISHGEYLAFVDSDVELSPQWLRDGLVVFRQQDVVASGCFPGVPREATWVQRTWDLHQRGRTRMDAVTPTAWLSSMNLLVRRDDFLAVSGFNEHLTTAEDVDLSYRLGQRGRILNNPSMQAVHWGEARDLGHFMRKEIWRGKGNLQGVLSHGLRLDELPSLGYPLYMLVAIVLLGAGVIMDLMQYRLLFTPVAAGLLVLPALLLALRSGYQAARLQAIPQLSLLYFAYGLARAFSLFRP
jgi:glycosyltransferase involved in cell wall biosynthesis